MSQPEQRDFAQMALEMRQAAHAMVLGGKSPEEKMRVSLKLLDAVSDLSMGNADDQAKLFLEAEKIGIHIRRPHFYSPTPTVGELGDGLWNRNDAGIEWNDRGSARLLQEISEFAGDFVRIVESGWDPRNPAFSHNDASTYYCMVRHLRPGRIVEVGGGYSTQLAALAAEANGSCQVTCIEPHPSEPLEGLDVRLIESRVQDADAGEFGDLGAGDVLFIDSSHVSKTGSDVNHLFFKVLPALARGVYVHFHDIFLPYEYPREWIKEKALFWNEQYLLRAFLMGNSEWSIRLPVHRLSRTSPDLLQKSCPSPTEMVTGGSFWIQRGPDPASRDAGIRRRRHAPRARGREPTRLKYQAKSTRGQ